MNHTQWKYQVSEIAPQLLGSSVSERIREELDKLGPQGWELVAVEYNNIATRLYFKRPA